MAPRRHVVEYSIVSLGAFVDIGAAEGNKKK